MMDFLFWVMFNVNIRHHKHWFPQVNKNSHGILCISVSLSLCVHLCVLVHFLWSSLYTIIGYSITENLLLTLMRLNTLPLLLLFVLLLKNLIRQRFLHMGMCCILLKCIIYWYVSAFETIFCIVGKT